MKKAICVLMSIFLLLSICACGNEPQAVPAEHGEAAENIPEISEEAPEPAEEGGIVLSEDHLVEYDGWISGTDCVLLLENSSSKPMTADISGLAKDSGGNTLGEKKVSVYAGPGESFAAKLSFSGITGIAEVEYTIEDEPDDRPSARDQLTIETVSCPGGVQVSVTNNGPSAAKVSDGFVLFYDAEGKLADAQSFYAGGYSLKLLPGESDYDFVKTDAEYDRIEVYASAAAVNVSGSTELKYIPSSEFETEVFSGDRNGTMQQFVLVTNNSESTVGVDVHCFAKDAADSVIDVQSGKIKVLAPGETGLVYFWYSYPAEQIAAVEPQLTCCTYVEEDPYLSDIEVSVQKGALPTILNVSLQNVSDTEISGKEAYILIVDGSELLEWDSLHIGTLAAGETSVENWVSHSTSGRCLVCLS